ncbi:ferric reductase-like transmembrane domain-containing protein [Photobacterium sp. OFAV2-7]|uniref:ferredoxin reductase family protein n=1 Tax=Photobacterium sp. OFAV2-7 TaxID=2917748 RepID=UPI001EF532F1|nr:ferric reductase-like transmembrane domain-containing protein [Photobacterium sp. OFAV2-7]MCG7587711.1 ferric reductase-like transmembrane domain-containing protein [Photobacterium sp. OFAV2-7]
MLKFTLIFVLLWSPALLMGYEEMGDFFFWRHQLTMLSGLIGLGYMSLAVLIAVRFDWVERQLNGLDKGYALHKRLGIGATVALVLHWFFVQSAKWLVQAGQLVRPERGRPEIEGVNWHHIASEIGEIAFYVFLLFSIISLVQAISYKRFKFTHKIGGLLVIAGVIHTALLLDWNSQSIMMNVAIAGISVAGVWCSLLSLTGKIGASNKSPGEVVSVERFNNDGESNSVIRLGIKLDSSIEYQEGQFAYLNFHDGEAPHPFSILNYNEKTQLIEFGIKDLGDYTHQMVNQLTVGSKVTVEGGYGCFQIPEQATQVWIGAGIGIVPFISRLYWLARKANQEHVQYKKIHLFYCVNSRKEAFFEKEILSILMSLDFIELEVLDADKGEFLSAEMILYITNSKEFDVSFCGPAAFGEILSTGLAAEGLGRERFHSEIFKMR